MAPKFHPKQAQSLPPTPTAVRTFTDFSQEHTRLTTLHGSTGALEVNGLGGFYGPMKQQQQPGYNHSGPMPPQVNFRPPFEAQVNDVYAHKLPGPSFGERDPPQVEGLSGGGGPLPTYAEEDLNDVFSNLVVSEPYVPGYIQGRSRRSSAPVPQASGSLWNSHDTHSNTHNGVSGFAPHHTVQWPPSNNIHTSQSAHGSASSIWSPTFPSPSESEISSFPDSDGSQSFNGFSPIYSPISGNLEEAVSTAVSTSASLMVGMSTVGSTFGGKISPNPVKMVQTTIAGTTISDTKVSDR